MAGWQGQVAAPARGTSAQAIAGPSMRGWSRVDVAFMIGKSGFDADVHGVAGVVIPAEVVEGHDMR
jgi:hypothetical protein